MYEIETELDDKQVFYTHISTSLKKMLSYDEKTSFNLCRNGYLNLKIINFH